MKREKIKRILKPKHGSKAKERLGLRTLTMRSLETSEDFDEFANRLGDPLTTWLRGIRDSADAVLTEPGDEAGPLTPDYHARKAAKAARRALHFLDHNKVDPLTRSAMLSAMQAVSDISDFEISAAWEPMAAKAIAQTPTPPSIKTKPWALELSQYLVQTAPSENFNQLWKRIPTDDEGFIFGGYEVFRDGNTLRADNGERQRSLEKQSFRRYVTVAKGKK